MVLRQVKARKYFFEVILQKLLTRAFNCELNLSKNDKKIDSFESFGRGGFEPKQECGAPAKTLIIFLRLKWGLFTRNTYSTRRTRPIEDKHNFWYNWYVLLTATFETFKRPSAFRGIK